MAKRITICVDYSDDNEPAVMLAVKHFKDAMINDIIPSDVAGNFDMAVDNVKEDQ